MVPLLAPWTEDHIVQVVRLAANLAVVPVRLRHPVTELFTSISSSFCWIIRSDDLSRETPSFVDGILEARDILLVF